MGSCTSDIYDDQRNNNDPPNHYSEFHDESLHLYPPVPAGNDLWAAKDEGSRISDTLLSLLQLDRARIDQE